MQRDELPSRSSGKIARAVGAALCVCALILTMGFTSGAWWNQRQAAGAPAYGRSVLPEATEKLGTQIMFRLFQDAEATIQALHREVERGSEQAAAHLRNIAKAAAK